MKPTCPPLRHLNPPGASDPKNRAAVAAESCLPTNSSAVEKVKSAESGAEMGFSQNGLLYIPSEFGKLNPEAPATGTTTGEQSTNLGASTRRARMSHAENNLCSNAHIGNSRISNQLQPSLFGSRPLSSYEKKLLTGHLLPTRADEILGRILNTKLRKNLAKMLESKRS